MIKKFNEHIENSNEDWTMNAEEVYEYLLSSIQINMKIEKIDKKTMCEILRRVANEIETNKQINK